jgi:hypothetical protein
LEKNQRILAAVMNRSSQLAQPGNFVVRIHRNLPVAGLARNMNIGMACYYQANLSFCQLAVKPQLCWLYVSMLVFGQVIMSGRSNKAVYHSPGADLYWSEKA